MGNAPTTAAAVGNELLALGRSECIPIDQLKLQKLIFYAHAWHLAVKGVPLFEEEVEAWPWGPVIRSVYSETARYGRGPIESTLTVFERVGTGVLNFRIMTPQEPDADTKAFVKAVWDIHKNYSGIQLSNSTHAPGEPWTIVKDQYGTLDNKPTIPNELIAEIFKAKISNGNNAAQ